MRALLAAIAIVLAAVAAAPAARAIDWKPYVTLAPADGTAFVADSARVLPALASTGVPGINLAADGRVILGFSGWPGGRGAATSADGGRTFAPLNGIARPMQVDGGFVYLADGRTRFVTEEPAPNNQPNRHRSRIVSWISSDGLNWVREAGIRYQPGAADDSIASVCEVLQLGDAAWRMYYVGDWYRTNGIRTALTTDWGLTWTAESGSNILRQGDVDPHPVYLTNGQVRMYHRRSSAPAGVAFTDGDGLAFDWGTTQTVVADGAAYTDLKLDPWVVGYPNGDIACYIGAAPAMGNPEPPKVIAAWARATTSTGGGRAPAAPGLDLELEPIAPNPFSDAAAIRFAAPGGALRLAVYDALGRAVAVLLRGEPRAPGQQVVRFDAGGLPSGVYFVRLEAGGRSEARPILLVRE